MEERMGVRENMQSRPLLGKIFNIQRYSVQDGPGIRTTVFFSGCPLRCSWCSNPESQKSAPQLLHFENLCQKCYRCADVCPKQAITKNKNGDYLLNRQLCDVCGKCVKVCLNEALATSGRTVTVDEVYDVIRRDQVYYINSNGGVTVSGGEPAQQHEFAIQLLRKCHEHGIHTCLDTSGFADWDVMRDVLQYVDLVLLDNKHMNPSKHYRAVGVDNQKILENTKKIAESGIPVIIRVPLIPGINDDADNMTELAKFVTKSGLNRVDLLPYHRLGISKYQALGLTYELKELNSHTKEHVLEIVKLLESFGLSVSIV